MCGKHANTKMLRLNGLSVKVGVGEYNYFFSVIKDQGYMVLIVSNARSYNSSIYFFVTTINLIQYLKVGQPKAKMRVCISALVHSE